MPLCNAKCGAFLQVEVRLRNTAEESCAGVHWRFLHSLRNPKGAVDSNHFSEKAVYRQLAKANSAIPRSAPIHL
jgi:hypothetical protein